MIQLRSHQPGHKWISEVVTVGILSGIAEGEAGGVALKLESSGKPKAAKAKVQNRVHRQAG